MSKILSKELKNKNLEDVVRIVFCLSGCSLLDDEAYDEDDSYHGNGWLQPEDYTKEIMNNLPSNIKVRDFLLNEFVPLYCGGDLETSDIETAVLAIEHLEKNVRGTLNNSGKPIFEIELLTQLDIDMDEECELRELLLYSDRNYDHLEGTLKASLEESDKRLMEEYENIKSRLDGYRSDTYNYLKQSWFKCSL